MYFMNEPLLIKIMFPNKFKEDGTAIINSK